MSNRDKAFEDFWVEHREMFEALVPDGEVARMMAYVSWCECWAAAQEKQRLNPERKGITHKVCIGGQNVYFRTGEFEDGTLGEIFITIDREGNDLRVYDAVAIAVSIGLQHGVPLSEYVDKFEHQSFTPSGVTSNDRIPFAKSIIDYLAKWLKMKY